MRLATTSLRALAAATALGLGACTALAAPASAAPAGLDPEQQAAVAELSTAQSAAEERNWDAARSRLAEQAPADFYATPAQVPAAPGTLLRHEAMDFYLDPVKLIKHPATATRIMYSSTDTQGAPVAVTGTVLVPKLPWRGDGERPAIGYAAGTQGVGDQCAPSRTLSTGEQYEAVGISSLLAQGYAVVLTDYEGLGTAGMHTYMVRQTQAHAVLDSLRAAQQVPGTGLSDSTPTALVGYSQGGGASAAAAELAPSYAPELNVKSAVVGAPPADLTAVSDNIDGGKSAAFLFFALAGQLAAYGVDPQDYLNDVGQEVYERASTACSTDGSAFAGLDSATLTRTGETFPQLVRTDARLARIIAEQTLGADGRVPEVPVMIAHSYTDDVIPYRLGRDLGRSWCEAGARVRFDGLLTPTHVGGYVAALPRMVTFLDRSLQGKRTLDSCGWF